MNETGRIIERVSALLDDFAPDSEHTLMDGYARLLALEGERARLERRFTAVTRSLAEGTDAARLSELRGLKQRISGTEEELALLRGVLSAARRRLIAEGAVAAAERPGS